MAEFISVMGEWIPKKEKVALENKSDKEFEYGGKMIKPGEPFIYDGPDRGALDILKEEGVEKLGQNFKHNPEFLQSVRNMGFNNPEEYLKHIGFDEKKELERTNKLIDTEESHKLPEQRKEIVELGGGRDTSGNKNNDMIGGFGEERVRKVNEVKK